MEHCINVVPQNSILCLTLFYIMINDILSSAPIPRNLNTRSMLRTVRYCTSYLTHNSRLAGLNLLLTQSNTKPLCVDVSFPFLSVSMLYSLDVTYLACESLCKASRCLSKIQYTPSVCILTARHSANTFLFLF